MRNASRVGWAMLLLVLAALFILGPGLMGGWVDWLWFGELGQRGVYWSILGTQAMLGLTFGLALFALAFLNLRLARRSAPRTIPRPGAPEWHHAAGALARQGVIAALTIGSLVLGVFGGLIAASRWQDWILFRNAQSFGVADPIFKMDVGFFLFRYPFLQFAAGWLFAMLLLVAIATAVVYYLDGAVSFLEGQARIAPSVRAHVSVLLGLAFLVLAGRYWLGRYDLLLNPGGVVFGASYTDIHARLPALNILAVVAVIAAIGFFVNARVRALWLPGAALALMVVASFTVGSIYPSLVQRFRVAPNEQSLERPYIQHHLDATRQAYGLAAIKPVDYTPGQALRAAELQSESPTLNNIRLWDYRILGETYHGIQRLRDYYNVSNVDIDRYRVGGDYRQVMLSPRELVTERLQQRRWVNEVLQYTHGYGLVMSTVNDADAGGRPNWLISNLPLETEGGLEVTRPQIYFGMEAQRPVIAPSGIQEFDYQTQSDSRQTQYAGKGGIPVGSPLMRALFSAYLGDWNIFISDQIKPGSRILIRRHVRERVARLAPFLKYDRDPYLVVLDGKLVWVQDAYTVAETYPYSEPSSYAESAMLAAGAAGLEETRAGDFNYLRNSVKVVIDAYDGTADFYAVDERDPVLRAYRQAFPTLFKDAGQIPPSLVPHLRVPEDQFSLQARKLLRFHVTNPDVFYARSDVWEIPNEQLQGATGATMEPYYVIMRLPGESEEEFALILPFKTRQGTTMPGWLVARCDPESYGELRLYRFPATSQIDAPEQVDASIQTDPDIARYISLVDQRGSEVRYGNLLVLPVAQSLLYVKPLYLAARQQQRGQAGIPVLTRVIVAEKRGTQVKVVMEPTLAQALTTLVGGAGGGPAPPTDPGPSPQQPARPDAPAGTVPQLAQEAEAAFQAAEQAVRQGDWAEYGRQIERARTAIRRLREAAE